MLAELAIQSFDNDGVRAFFESGGIGARVGWRQIGSIVLRNWTCSTMRLIYETSDRHLETGWKR